MRIRPNWKCLLSAGLIALSAPPFEYTYLMGFALIPWFWALFESKDNRSSPAWIGFWQGYFMTLAVFYWIAPTLHQYGGLSWPLAILGLLLFGLIGQPHYVFISTFIKRAVVDPKVSKIVFASLLFAGADWVIPKLFADTLGHALVSWPRFRQVADLGGAHLMTAIIVAENFVLWSVIHRFKTRGQLSIWPAVRLSRGPIALGLGIFVASALYGHYRLAAVRDWISQPQAKISIALIQGNIGDFDKLASERGMRGAADQVLNTMFEVSKEALASPRAPTLLFWPETTYPSAFGSPDNPLQEQRDQRLRDFVNEHQTHLYFGGYDRELFKDFNSLFFLSPSVDQKPATLPIYHKNILLLFGEYIPGMESGPLQFLKGYFPQIGNFGRGPGPQAIEVPSGNTNFPAVKISPLICYEALFPNYSIQAARLGAHFIANITNDSWFGVTSAPSLHLAVTQFRSIETRLPQIRSTNTGYSAFIEPDGEISAKSGLFTKEALLGEVPILTPMPTLMKAWGDWFGIVSLLWAGIVIVRTRRLSKV